MTHLENRNIVILLLFLFGIAVTVSSLLLGRFDVSFNEFYLVIKSLFVNNIELPAQIETIILHIRLPRVIAAFFVGGTLSLTGAAYQGMFRNPMVSPSILGVSAGAGFGAALAILLSLSAFWLQIFSFTFGIAAVAIVYLISLSVGKRHDKCLTLILAGMMVSTVFAALISLLKYVADPYDSLPSIVYWLMGGLSNIELTDLKYLVAISIPGTIFLTMLGWKLDILSFGDDEANSIGINVDKFRFMVIIIATLMTAAAVSISGIIGWVGLLIPHITRMFVGSKNNVLLPVSFLIGGIFLMAVDDFSRTVSSMEIPLGITTSLIGAPFFVFVLIKTRKK